VQRLTFAPEFRTAVHTVLLHDLFAHGVWNLQCLRQWFRDRATRRRHMSSVILLLIICKIFGKLQNNYLHKSQKNSWILITDQIITRS